MSTTESLEQRLTALEKQVADLSQRIGLNGGVWPGKLFGRMQDFPEWEEVSRLGKEVRDAQADPDA